MSEILKSIGITILVIIGGILGLAILTFDAVIMDPETAAIWWLGILPAAASAFAYYQRGKDTREIAENHELAAYHRREMDKHAAKLAERAQEREQAGKNMTRKRRLRWNVRDAKERVRLLEAALPGDAAPPAARAVTA